MTITIEKDGKQFYNVKSASVTTSLRSLSGSFSIEASADETSTLPIKAGDAVRVLIDSSPAVTGYVDTLDVNYDDNSHSISVTGRDKTQDIIDSSMVGNKEFSGRLTLSSVISKVLTDLGLTDISIIDTVGTLSPFSTEEVISASVGQSCLDFLDSYARKRQVLLTTDGHGNIVIARGSSAPSGLSLVHLINMGSSKNNVKSAKLHTDLTKRFSSYFVRTQGNPIFSLSSTPGQLSDIQGTANDSKVRSSRRLEFQAEESMTVADAKNRAIWEANLRRVNSFSYSATVQGHSSNGVLWKPNQLIHVTDEFADFRGNLLISDVTYNYSENEGSTSILTLVSPDAYTLQAELDALSEKLDQAGAAFTL